MLHGVHANHRAQHYRLGLAWVAQGQVFGLVGKLPGEFIGNLLVDDDPLGGHANLPAVGKAAKGGAVHRIFNVGIVQNHHGRFAPQLQHHGFEVPGAGHGDDFAHAGGTGEVHAAHRRMRHDGLHHRARVGRGIGDVVEHTRWKTRIFKRLCNQQVGARAVLRALEDHGVAASQWHADGTHTQNDGRVPGCNAQHHASRLAHPHGQRARHIRRNHFATDLGGQRSGFANHARGQHHVEATPHAGGPGFGTDRLDELGRLGFQRVGCFQQQGAAFAGAGLAPGFEGFGRRIHRHHRILR